jgi:hypothetical protein
LRRARCARSCSNNAFDANARVRGFSDTAIDEGMAPEAAAARILDALRNGERELVLAESSEAEVVCLRRSDANKLFDLAAKRIADGYAQQLGAKKPSPQSPVRAARAVPRRNRTTCCGRCPGLELPVQFDDSAQGELPFAGPIQRTRCMRASAA